MGTAAYRGNGFTDKGLVARGQQALPASHGKAPWRHAKPPFQKHNAIMKLQQSMMRCKGR